MILLYTFASSVAAFLLIGLLVFVCLYLIYSFFCEISGAPFVPTSRRQVREILDQAKLKRGQLFIELGSGDGRVSRLAAKKYRVKAIGIELNLLLVIWSILLARIQRVEEVKFLKQNMFRTDLSSADVVFMFLVTKTVRKLAPKLLSECRNNTLIISHGFAIPELKNYLVSETSRPVFSTYYYRLKRHFV